MKKEASYEVVDLWEIKEVTQNQLLNRCSFIQCVKTNKLMNVPALEDGEHICIYEAHRKFNQRWKIYKAGEVFIIKSFKTELNLDVE